MVFILFYIVFALFLFLLYMTCMQHHKRRKHEKVDEEIIVKINNSLDDFVQRLSILYPHDERVQRLKLRYKKSALLQSQDHNTYTINKQQIMMCIRDYSNNKEIHDDFNLLMFVAIHELGHVMSESTHHTDEFWSNFKFLLKNAAEMRFYYPVDYTYDNKNYCMMQVNDNPFFYQRTPRDFAEQITSIVTL
jgi:hypothetical protein